jgi:hypothetical protein
LKYYFIFALLPTIFPRHPLPILLDRARHLPVVAVTGPCQIAQSLAGRTALLRLLPLSLAEFDPSVSCAWRPGLAEFRDNCGHNRNMTEEAGTTLQAAAPRIVESAGGVVVSQRRTIGWALLAFSPGLPLLAWIASGKPLSNVWAELMRLSGLSIAVVALIGLILLALFAYGVFWLVWQRTLTIDTAARRYVFVTGVWPWLSQHRGECSDRLTLAILRQQIASTGSHGDAGSMSGPPRVHWQLQLVIHEDAEPLYLGDVAEHTEALVVAERWRQRFPNLKIEDDGQ